MTPPIDYKKIAHEFPQVPEWTKVVKWSPEDGCYVGYIEGPLGPCCHGDDPGGRARRAHRNRTRMAGLTWHCPRCLVRVPLSALLWIQAEEQMNKKERTKLVHEGNYVAEVDVELL